MRNIYLYGELAEKYGKVFRLRANTIGAAVKLLEANFPGFQKNIISGRFRVVAGKSVEDENGINFDNELVRSRLNLGSKDLHIMPVPAGAGGNTFRIVLGVALIAAAFYFAPGIPLQGAMADGSVMGGTAGTSWGATAFSLPVFGAVHYSSIALLGASLILGGVSGLLTPKISSSSADQRASFIFNGAANTVQQGGPVPVVYGRMMVGSTVISAGITVEQISINTNGWLLPNGTLWTQAGATLAQ